VTTLAAGNGAGDTCFGGKRQLDDEKRELEVAVER
jgi:hypothetical protein